MRETWLMRVSVAIPSFDQVVKIVFKILWVRGFAQWLALVLN
jgi:hypothetical protein